MRYKPKKNKYTEWHNWFAWYPVWSQHFECWIWLETVRRRQVVTTIKTLVEFVTYKRTEYEIIV